MENIHDELLDNQDDDLRYQSSGFAENNPDGDDDDLIDDDDDDFDIETGDDIDVDVDDELVTPSIADDDDDDWDDDDDVLGEDDEADDDLLASADDSEKSVTHDTSFNSDFSGRPQGRTSGRMTDHEPGTTGFTSTTD